MRPAHWTIWILVLSAILLLGAAIIGQQAYMIHRFQPLPATTFIPQQLPTK
jgi:hypothetical protein